VEQALHVIQKHNDKLIVLLHCVSNYPAAPEDVNLRAMETMELAFHLPVGYSDHTLGIEVPIAAVSLGASVIEKHFTLDSSLEGADHALSLDPDSFARMVMAIRNVEVALGDGLKKPAEAEIPVREAARKSLVAKIDIPDGTVLTRDMVTTKRPGKGIPPTHLDLLLGKTLLKAAQHDEPLHWDMFVS
ncbi:MAG: N-acetylneuraminate synthase family protein, partial [Spirochaetota bacterium]|nr:N-acetylneuraminate synthase family protein [Spirochaetota bacterium]